MTLGLAGLLGVTWFVWGTVLKTGRASRVVAGRHGDFLAACSVACTGYGAGMFLFDSIAFIQVTLLLFITAAMGLKTIVLADGGCFLASAAISSLSIGSPVRGTLNPAVRRTVRASGTPHSRRPCARRARFGDAPAANSAISARSL